MGRFINADAFVTTGTGLLGNNMFTYCNNDSVNNFDPTGYASWGTNTVAMKDGYSGFYPGSAEYVVKKIQQQEKWNKFCNWLSNEDPQVAIDGGPITFYKGAPVINMPFKMTPFSFGVIVMGSQFQSDAYGITMLNHEYGHTRQLQTYGLSSYISSIFVPSLSFNILDRLQLTSWSYYSTPWEYEADLLGGVVRNNYAPWAASMSEMYSYVSIFEAVFPW